MYQKQRGASMWQWLIVGGMAAVFIYVGIMLFTVYFENMSVKKALQSIEQLDKDKRSKSDIKKKIENQFNVNQVTRATGDNIKFKTLKSGGLEVSVEYEVKIHLVSNIYVLTVFNDKVEI